MAELIYVLGLDDFRRRYLETIHDADRMDFRSLLDFGELVRPPEFPVSALLEKAERQIREADQQPAAIITHWDFPSSTMAPILCKQLGLRYASPEAVLRCEHKYWFRLEQEQAIADMAPAYCAVDPFADDPLAQVTLDYPFWLKPVKAFGSYLGFRIHDEAEFHHAIGITHEKIRRLGDGFNQALAHVELPEALDGVDGNACIAEEIVRGKQCGIEGYMLDGEFAVHGAFDTVKDAENKSFTRYEYPSFWPRPVQERMHAAAETVLRHIGYDNAPFGMEFFWDEETNRLKILEVNTRISQSHCYQFVEVEGVSNHEVAVKVALGTRPSIRHTEGRYETAAKFMLRRYGAATVTRVPTHAEICAVECSVPDCHVQLGVAEGDVLAELRDQDSYSVVLANIWLSAKSQDEMLARYRDVADRLHFEFSDGGAPEAMQFEKVAY